MFEEYGAPYPSSIGRDLKAITQPIQLQQLKPPVMKPTQPAPKPASLEPETAKVDPKPAPPDPKPSAPKPPAPAPAPKPPAPKPASPEPKPPAPKPPAPKPPAPKPASPEPKPASPEPKPASPEEPSNDSESTEGFSTGSLQNQWSDIMVRNSVYAAFVFLIVAHPATFKTFDNGFKSLGITIPNKNVQLLVHAVVFALLMYFGTTMVFDPFLNTQLN